MQFRRIFPKSIHKLTVRSEKCITIAGEYIQTEN